MKLLFISIIKIINYYNLCLMTIILFRELLYLNNNYYHLIKITIIEIKLLFIQI